MELENQQTVLLTGNEHTTQGSVHIQRFTGLQRVKSAIIVGLLGLLATIVMVAIPLLHFILVPFGLIVTFLLVNNALSDTEKIIGGTASCPYCNHTINFVKRRAKYPFLERCTECSRESSVKQI